MLNITKYKNTIEIATLQIQKKNTERVTKNTNIGKGQLKVIKYIWYYSCGKTYFILITEDRLIVVYQSYNLLIYLMLK